MDFQRSDVEQELQKILTSAAFENAERSKAILAYVVNEELDGQGARIKAYSIGIQVLDRPDSFDPIADSIVRVEAGRLRKSLDLYYRTEGVEDPIRIVIERGSYRPSFVPGRKTGSHPRKPRSFPAYAILLAALLIAGSLAVFSQFWLQRHQPHSSTSDTLALVDHLQGPRILAVPFTNTSGNTANDILTTGLTVDTISELARFRWLTVYVARQSENAPEHQAPGNTKPIADYRLTGQVRRLGDDLTITARLEDYESGAILWSETYRALMTVDDLFAVQQNIAKSIAVTVGQPSGVVGQIEQGLSLRDKAPAYEAYHCVMLTYVYWRNFDPQQHKSARDCFEKTLKQYPNYAEGLAAYAFILLDEYRYKYNPDPGHDPVELALQYASAALKADPYSSLAAQSRMALAALKGDLTTFKAIGQEAIRRNPNNPDLLSDYGSKISLAFGDWVTGTALIQRSWSLNPIPPSWSYIAPATHAYFDGRCEDALALTNRANSPRQTNFLLLRAACNHELGNEQELAQTLSDMRKAGISTDAELKDVIGRLFMAESLKTRLTRDVSAALKDSQPQAQTN
ncbi:MAG: hypothetical protein R3D43_07135 [Tepidamorphaceae bacterium]